MKTVLFILSSVPHPDAKIGRRQAVMIEDAEIAALLLAWAAEVKAAEGEAGRLFPNLPRLRVALKRALAVFDDGAWDSTRLAQLPPRRRVPRLPSGLRPFRDPDPGPLGS